MASTVQSALAGPFAGSKLLALTIVTVSLHGLCCSAQQALPWIHIRAVDLTANPNATRRFVFSDEWGREMTLRGACVENEERNFPGNHTNRSQNPADYVGACPSNFQSFEEPPICQVDAGKGKYNASFDDLSLNDFAQLRALGFNAIRLPLSWSELEAIPGIYNPTYIDRVEQLVDWAEEQGIYTVLDMHEDLYSMWIFPGPNETAGYPPLLVPTGSGQGNDGAPEWAVDTEGWPSWAVLGIGNLNLAMMRAFQNFWENKVIPGIPQGSAPGPGIQDHYIGALAALAQRFANRSAVLGWETINEPEPGTTLDPFTFSRDFLYPLHRRCIHAITGERDGLPTCAWNETSRTDCAYPDLGIRDTRHAFFIEPIALRNTLDFSPQVSVPVSNYSQVVYAPHTYSHVFTIDRVLLPYGINVSWYPPGFEFAYQTAWGEANAMKAAVWVTEFGTSVDDDPNTMDHTLDAQDAYMTGATVWAWKSNCVSSTVDGCNWAWTVYFPTGGNDTGPIAPNGALDPEREWSLSRTHIRGAVGELLSYAFNRTTRAFFAFANVTAATWESLIDRGASGPCGGAATIYKSVPAEAYAPALHEAHALNGTVTEVFIPRTIPLPVSVVGPAIISSVVTWPDGSRSAYVQPTGPGLYGVLVTNASDTVTVESGAAASECASDSDAAGRLMAQLVSRRDVALLNARRSARLEPGELPQLCSSGDAANMADAKTAAAVLRSLPGIIEEQDARKAQCAYTIYQDWLRRSLGAALDVAGLDAGAFSGLR